MKVFEEFDFENEPEAPSQKGHEEQLKELIEYAKQGKHSEWEFITCLEQFKVVNAFSRAMTKLAGGFKKSTKSLYKIYNKNVLEGKSTLDIVLAIKELSDTTNFYYGERDLAEDMIDEYKAYVCSGHAIDTALGYVRRSEEMYDHRKPKPADM